MTEDEWLTCSDPDEMLRFLHRTPPSFRKLRLFIIACVRRVPTFYPTDKHRCALDVALLLADKRAPEQDVNLFQSCLRLDPLAPLLAPLGSAPFDLPIALALALGRSDSQAFLRERAAQADILRELFGNPLRPLQIDPAWLRWNEGFIPGMARGIYEDRTFRRLAILSDALEDAGCESREILDHLRSPGPHPRGCYVLDALMTEGRDP